MQCDTNTQTSKASACLNCTHVLLKSKSVRELTRVVYSDVLNFNLSKDTMVHLSSLLLKHYHGGHVVIRLALGGCTNRPFYRIVAAYNKRARDSKHIEQLGSFDPLPNIYNEKLVSLNFERIKYWIACGAHPTKPVARLLGLSGFFPLHPMTVTKAERLRKTAGQKEALGAPGEVSEEASESKPETA
ncbi:small ribosomal subunit protein bS16m-like [Acipenser ruthenus]|nr:small ribosomal subunit protein bS16m-like [Acipenser ruthenus]